MRINKFSFYYFTYKRQIYLPFIEGIYFLVFDSPMHKAKIPPIKLTNNNIQTFNPTPTGSPFLTLFPKKIVIGRHHQVGRLTILVLHNLL